MTNLINKQHLVAAIDSVGEGLNLMGPFNDLLASMGKPECAAYAKGAADVLNALIDGLVEGKYDACDEDVLAECAVVRYSEETGEDTEDMDDLAPEEEPAEGVIMLPPEPSSSEREELLQWAATNGFIVKYFKV